MSMSRPASSAACAVALLLLAACGAPEDQSLPAPARSSGAASDTRAPDPADESIAPTVTSIEVDISEDDVLPNAQGLDLSIGEPLVVTVDSDRAGELHVHSKPEAYVGFDQGVSTSEIVVRTPGTVEVEDHETGVVVAILEVR